MGVLENLAMGLQFVLAVETLLALALGVLTGVLFGIMPGLTATMGVALLAPFTFGFEPLVAIPFLIGVYRGGLHGGVITGILVGVPGTPANVPVLMDGYPLTQQGYPLTALRCALYSSVFGAFLAALLLVTVIEQIARVALRIGSPELFTLLVLSMTLVAFVSGKQLSKGILAAALGMFVGLIGLDPVTGTARFTFGFDDLLGGVSIIPMFIGLFAVSEMAAVVERTMAGRRDRIRREEAAAERLRVRSDGGEKRARRADGEHGIEESDDEEGGEGEGSRHREGTGQRPRQADDNIGFFTVVRRYWRAILIGAGSGSFVGALPGVGSETSPWLSYGLAKRLSPRGRNFGRGEPEGVVAPESANDAVASAGFVPTLVFGIPGDMPLAVMMGAFMAQGLRPGPRLFERNPEVMFGVVMAVLLSSIMLFLIVRPLTPILSRVVQVPSWTLVPVIAALCMAGAYGVNNDPFDLYILAVFGAIGVIMRKTRTPLPPFVLAFIVGPAMERAFRESLMLGRGWGVFLESPASIVFLTGALAIAMGALLAATRRRVQEG